MIQEDPDETPRLHEAGRRVWRGGGSLPPLSPTGAQTKMVFKASDVQPVGYPTVVTTENLGKKLEAATNGRLSVQMYPSMQLGGEKETIEQTPGLPRDRTYDASRLL